MATDGLAMKEILVFKKTNFRFENSRNIAQASMS